MYGNSFQSFPSVPMLREYLQDPERRQQGLEVVGAYIVSTCIMFGASATTAYKVAAAVVEGLEEEVKYLCEKEVVEPKSEG